MNGADIWRSGGAHQLYVLGGAAVTPRCLRTSGLSPRQTKFCQLYPDHMASVGSGARTAIAECQWQFRHRRWNCSTVDDNSVFGPVIDTGTSCLYRSVRSWPPLGSDRDPCAVANSSSVQHQVSVAVHGITASSLSRIHDL